MEFLPAQGTPTFDRAGRRNEPITRVRLAWYYRPSDVSDRTVADSRLLLAAIYSEVCELSQLRSRCFVHHRDRISDLAGWKKRPDRFYFTRLFDPWLRTEFEVIPATTVRNGGWPMRCRAGPCGTVHAAPIANFVRDADSLRLKCRHTSGRCSLTATNTLWPSGRSCLT